MTLATLAIIFAAGFVIMTPVGPVSTICIRRSFVYGRRAGIVAGAGNSLAMTVYATVGVTGTAIVTHVLTRFSSALHIAISIVLVVVAIVMWRARPMLPVTATQTRANLMGGFGATLAIALANPADIVLFAALFSGLGIGVHTSLEHIVFSATIFAGGLAYWIALAFVLARWRAGLTITRMLWLNRTCSALLLLTAVASLASLSRMTN